MQASTSYEFRGGGVGGGIYKMYNAGEIGRLALKSDRGELEKNGHVADVN